MSISRKELFCANEKREKYFILCQWKDEYVRFLVCFGFEHSIGLGSSFCFLRSVVLHVVFRVVLSWAFGLVLRCVVLCCLALCCVVLCCLVCCICVVVLGLMWSF